MWFLMPEACAVVHQCLLDNIPASRAAARLRNLALALQSADNVSVIVVYLDRKTLLI